LIKSNGRETKKNVTLNDHEFSAKGQCKGGGKHGSEKQMSDWGAVGGEGGV